jgi:DGQHR domain-containing protein
MINVTSQTSLFPALQGMVGNRLVTYTTQLSPTSIESFLGHDPRSRYWKKLNGDIEAIYSKVQRTTAPARMRGITDYIRHRFVPDSPLLGAFPAVSIAVQNQVGFVESEEKGMRGVGNINIDMSSRNARIVVDGLGRISAILDLVEMSFDATISEEEANRRKALLDAFTVPVVIYAPYPGTKPLSSAEMGQLFFDFNFKASPVQQRIAISLDQSDPYIQATNLLARKSNAIQKNGGMEERAASLGSKSTSLVVQQVLLRAVRAAMEGEAAGESNKAEVANPNLTLENIRERIQHLAEFLDTFAEEMGKRFAEDKRALHLASPGWQAFGVIYNDVVFRLKAPDPLATARALGRIDWSRSGPLWSDLVIEKTDKKGLTELVLNTAGASARREIIKRVRGQLNIHQLIEEIEQKSVS